MLGERLQSAWSTLRGGRMPPPWLWRLATTSDWSSQSLMNFGP
ncbi:TPA: hypothetical protein ACS29Z_005449 [Klebsiella pneumoniae]